MDRMERSCFTLDLGAIRRNAATLLRAAEGAELWAVVKAEGYGHGAVDVSKAALDGGATALCVATLPEALHLRAALRNARILVMGPVSEREIGEARVARLELVAADERIPEGVRVHLKLDTGMGRWGAGGAAVALRATSSGVMSHLASAEADPAFTQLQVERFREATAGPGLAHAPSREQRRRTALRGGAVRRRALRDRALRHLAVRHGSGRRRPRARPALGVVRRARQEARAWREHGLRAASSSPTAPTWIGVVPVGYADGFRRDMTGTEVLVQGERRRVVGTISMDALAVVLEAPVPHGTPVTLLGDGILMEEHARVAGTIAYEIATGLEHALGPRPAGRKSMDERLREILGDEDAWVVGGAVRDELLLRPVLDLDVACAEPRDAANRFARRFGGSVFPLSERHGAWRVVVDGIDETVDFTPVGDGIDADLATRDFTFNAIAVHVRTGATHDPHDGRADLAAGVIRAVSESIFLDDPLRLLRAVRFEDELGFGMDERTEALLRASAALVTQPAGERILAELERLSADRLPPPRRGRPARAASEASSTSGSTRSTIPTSGSSSCSATTFARLPISNELKRYAAALRRARRPEDPSPRSIHRFRRDTEPWALDALAYVGAPELVGVVEAARLADPSGSARPRRRAGSRAGPGDRTYPRRHRGGAGSGDDLDARRGARARARARLVRGARMSVELRLALQERRSDDLAQRVRRLLGPFTGNEAALDAGCGTGALAFALAPNVAEVVGVDTRADYLEAGRESAPANVRFEEADVMALPFGYAEFDLVCCHRVLHHVRRPELAVSELARVARSGGKVFIADQLGSVDPLLSLEQDRFEHLRDATHQRLLPEADIRGYLDANDLVLISSEVTREKRRSRRAARARRASTRRSASGSAGPRPRRRTRSRSAGTSPASRAA